MILNISKGLLSCDEYQFWYYFLLGRLSKEKDKTFAISHQVQNQFTRLSNTKPTNQTKTNKQPNKKPNQLTKQ